jgi:hypothetical protein
MTDWSVHIAVEGRDPVLDPTDSRLDIFLDALQHAHGAVGGGGRRYQATMSVLGQANATDAADAGLREFDRARVKADLPEWPVVRLECVTEAELEQSLATPVLPELAGVAEAAEMLSVSKQRVSQLAAEHADFPSPVVMLRATPVWYVSGIRGFAGRWQRKAGRPPKPRPQEED